MYISGLSLNKKHAAVPKKFGSCFQFSFANPPNTCPVVSFTMIRVEPVSKMSRLGSTHMHPSRMNTR